MLIARRIALLIIVFNGEAYITENKVLNCNKEIAHLGALGCI